MEEVRKILELASRADEIYDEVTGFGYRVVAFDGEEWSGCEGGGYAVWKYGGDSFKVYYFDKAGDPQAMGQTKKPLSELRKYYSPGSNIAPFRESEYFEVVDISEETLHEFGSVLFYELLKLLQDKVAI